MYGDPYKPYMKGKQCDSKEYHEDQESTLGYSVMVIDGTTTMPRERGQVS